jgi:uncharacterized protein (DUF433 family)
LPALFLPQIKLTLSNPEILICSKHLKFWISISLSITDPFECTNPKPPLIYAKINYILVVLLHPRQATNVMQTIDLFEVIERHPTKVSGAWVFRGTRVPVAAFFENLKDGASIDQFLEWFPGVTRAQVEVLLDRALASITQMVA